MTVVHALHPLASVVAALALGLCMLVPQRVSAQGGGDPSGVWLTESGTSTVRVARCGGGYCGTLVSVSGSGLDANNPDPALKGRRLVGVRILNAGTPGGDGFEGSLYNPNDGKTYSGSMTPKGPDRLEVSGCVLRVICKSQTWTRVK